MHDIADHGFMLGANGRLANLSWRKMCEWKIGVPRASVYTCATLGDRHPNADELHLAFRSLVSITESSYHPSRLLRPHRKECIELTIGAVYLELAHRVQQWRRTELFFTSLLSIRICLHRDECL